MTGICTSSTLTLLVRLNAMQQRRDDNAKACIDDGADPNVCMCGADMAGHTGWEGHSPMSQVDWCIDRRRASARDEKKVATDRKKDLTP